MARLLKCATMTALHVQVGNNSNSHTAATTTTTTFAAAAGLALLTLTDAVGATGGRQTDRQTDIHGLPLKDVPWPGLLLLMF